jgi:hypothetical protein
MQVLQSMRVVGKAVTDVFLHGDGMWNVRNEGSKEKKQLFSGLWKKGQRGSAYLISLASWQE